MKCAQIYGAGSKRIPTDLQVHRKIAYFGRIFVLVNVILKFGSSLYYFVNASGKLLLAFEIIYTHLFLFTLVALRHVRYPLLESPEPVPFGQHLL